MLALFCDAALVYYDNLVCIAYCLEAVSNHDYGLFFCKFLNCGNRMMLQKVMVRNGFEPLDCEWWHFTLKDEPYPYHQMIVWNIPNGDIVGAYRLGFGPEIMAAHGGIGGFYSDSLIKYGPKAKEYLPISMELGRSFVAEKYQREVIPLKLLLTGLAVAAYQNPEIQYYTGPVSISSDMPSFYQSLVVHYLMRDYRMNDADSIAEPSHPFKDNLLRVDPDQLLQFPKEGIDYFDRLISSLSDGKYRRCGGSVDSSRPRS